MALTQADLCPSDMPAGSCSKPCSRGACFWGGEMLAWLAGALRGVPVPRLAFLEKTLVYRANILVAYEIYKHVKTKYLRQNPKKSVSGSIVSERLGIETCGCRKWTWVAVQIGELCFPLHVHVYAMLQSFLPSCSCSILGFPVFALFSSFASAKSPAQGVRTQRCSVRDVSRAAHGVFGPDGAEHCLSQRVRVPCWSSNPCCSCRG